MKNKSNPFIREMFLKVGEKGTEEATNEGKTY